LEKKTNKIAFVSGNFNILHPGHLRLFKFAKEFGLKLVVAVYSDKYPGASSILPEKLRLDAVASNKLVDECFLISENVNITIKKLRPKIVVKGKEYEFYENEESEILKTYGGELVFSSGEVFSSLDLIRNGISNKKNITPISKEYLQRHALDSKQIRKTILEFSNLKVLVFGDLIIDEYITCDPLGLSQEDPTIVVTPIDSKLFIGGAGIVALHASSLGADVKFISVIGNDETGKYAEKELIKTNLTTLLVKDKSRPTTLKQRYRCKNKTLLRVSKLHQGSISLELQKKILGRIKQEIKNINLFVFSDFNYGCIPNELAEKIIKLCNQNNVLVVADSQSSSQVGDISRFKNSYLLTPTEHEARISLRDKESGLIVLAERLRVKAQAKNIFLKIGEDGLIVHAESNGKNNWVTDRITALNTAPLDVSGAGDSMLISSAMSLAVGSSIWEAAAIGSLSAAIQVSRIGNVPICLNELLEIL
jgi:rfaE bifunctional protein kinase chain/domain